jgi:hypothetical protein
VVVDTTFCSIPYYPMASVAALRAERVSLRGRLVRYCLHVRNITQDLISGEDLKLYHIAIECK